MPAWCVREDLTHPTQLLKYVTMRKNSSVRQVFADALHSKSVMMGCIMMRIIFLASTVFLVMNASAAELESRVLTHYIPQDFLETAVRTEGWTEVSINLKG